MWPEPGEALSRTLEAEDVLADIYATALNRWVAEVRPFVVPDLAGQVINGDPALVAAGVPPDPDQVGSGQGLWDQLSTELILACLSILWAMSVVESVRGLGISIPKFDLSKFKIPRYDRAVYAALTRTTSTTRSEIEQAEAYVQDSPELTAFREDYLDTRRESVRRTPEAVRDKLAIVARDASPADVEVAVNVRITDQREAVTAALQPGSELVRDVARYESYQAASVQNAAVVEAAVAIGDGELEKIWICTIDSKTRDTHWAADGQRAPLSGTFTVGTAQLRWPGDETGPAAEVRNCRCRVGILGADEDMPDEVDRHTERLSGRDATARNRQGSQADEKARRDERGVVRARDDEDGIGRTAAAAPEGATMADEDNLFRTFTDQPIAFIGIETSDGRMLAEGIEFDVRTPPLPGMWCKKSGYGHMDANTVIVIESARIEGDRVLASGYALNTPEADEAVNEMSHKVSRPSVDLAATKWMLTVDGKEITEEEWWDLPMDAHVVQTITAAELIGVTMVATPAFGDTMIEFNAERESREASLVASAAEAFRPRVYDPAMFAAPGLTEPTLTTMDPETGRIFGHLACFGTCHRSIQARCTEAPRSPSQYSQFHTSPPVRLSDGTNLAVGRLTVGTGHAPDSMRGGPALAHYDNTGTCWALVRAYETDIGIEFSGVAAPWATPEQIEMGLSAPLSGDWRDFGQGLDLIAALSVNTPGFAVRGRTDAAGRPAALVASLGPSPAQEGTPAPTMTRDEIMAAVREGFTASLTEMREAEETAALLAAADELAGPLPEPKTPAEEVAEMLAQVR